MKQQVVAHRLDPRGRDRVHVADRQEHVGRGYLMVRLVVSLVAEWGG